MTILVNIITSSTAINIQVLINCRNRLRIKNIEIITRLWLPPPPVINSLLHWDGYQPSARGFGQYWGLKSCGPINTLCAPVSAPSRLLHVPLPAGGLAHGFPFSTACLHSVSHTPSAPSFFFYFSTNSPSDSSHLSPHLLLIPSWTFSLDRMS